MPYDIAFVEAAGYVAGTLTGEISEAALQSARSEMNALLTAHKCRALLVDATGIEGMLPVPADYDFTTQHQTELPRGTRHAVLVGDDRVERMQFVEDVAQNRNIDLRVFTSKGEAIEWLVGKPSD